MGSYNEHQILVTQIMVELSKNPNVRVWANNTGVAESLDSYRVVRYGLVGSADITGIIGPNGTRLEIEVKTGKGKQTLNQKNFEQMIKKLGGVYIVARSVLDATEGIRNADGS